MRQRKNEYIYTYRENFLPRMDLIFEGINWMKTFFFEQTNIFKFQKSRILFDLKSELIS